MSSFIMSKIEFRKNLKSPIKNGRKYVFWDLFIFLHFQVFVQFSCFFFQFKFAIVTNGRPTFITEDDHIMNTYDFSSSASEF